MSPPDRSKFSKTSTASDVVEGLDLSGKTYLITGANCGIGFETAKALAKQRAHVIIACRSPSTASEAKDRILDDSPHAKVDILKVDLSELKSVEQCAESFNKSNWSLDCLILNAGVVGPLHHVTDDGFETTFQVNHLAQFYLTQLLLPKLKASAPSRLVVVSSDAHKSAFLGPNDIKWETLSPTHKAKVSSGFVAYSHSKFCNILFANEFNARYAKEGITANSLHPGVVSTSIARNSKMTQFCFACCMKPVVITPERGAATTTYLATAPEIEGRGGEYYVYCQSVIPTGRARNAESRAKLWTLSEEMLDHYRTSIERQINARGSTTSQTSHTSMPKQLSLIQEQDSFDEG